MVFMILMYPFHTGLSIPVSVCVLELTCCLVYAGVCILVYYGSYWFIKGMVDIYLIIHFDTSVERNSVEGWSLCNTVDMLLVYMVIVHPLQC